MIDLRCEELGVVLASDLGFEVLGGEVELVALGSVLVKLLGLLLQQLQRVILRDGLALGCLDTVPCPLPQLRSRDLGCGGILHEEVDGHAADAADPGFHVAEADVEILADAGLGDLAGNVHVEQVIGGDVDILAADVHLVRCGHVLVEDVRGDLGERRVSDPGTIVAGAHLAELVGGDLGHGGVIGLLVVLDGDLSGHAAHSMDSALVTGLDKELDVGIHEGGSHGHGIAVWENEVRVLTETLDSVEDVIPTTAVQARRVVTELIDDLFVISSRSKLNIRSTLPRPSQTPREWSRSGQYREWCHDACQRSPEQG